MVVYTSVYIYLSECLNVRTDRAYVALSIIAYQARVPIVRTRAATYERARARVIFCARFLSNVKFRKMPDANSLLLIEEI